MESNGYTKMVIRILIGIVIMGVVSILGFHETKISANDKEGRIRDTKLDDKVDFAILEQKQDISDIKLVQMSMSKDIQYIVQELKRNL